MQTGAIASAQQDFGNPLPVHQVGPSAPQHLSCYKKVKIKFKKKLIAVLKKTYILLNNINCLLVLLISAENIPNSILNGLIEVVLVQNDEASQYNLQDDQYKEQEAVCHCHAL